MSKIVELKNTKRTKLYPITKTTAVYNDDGVNVDDLLQMRDDEINAANSRIDSLTRMEEGSTTGDAELMDIRIGADGTQFPTAGAAVRSQIDELNETTTTQQSVINNLKTLLGNKIDDAYVRDGYLYMTADEEVVVGPLGPFSGGGGGGGGGDNNAVLTVTNTSGWLSTTISYGSPCPITFTWSSLENDIPTGPGKMTILVNGIQRVVSNISQGNVRYDLGPLLASGDNTVRLRVSDSYGNTKSINFTISSVLLTLESMFDDLQQYSGPITFSYVPTGAVSKTVYFIVDDELIGTSTVTVSGRQQSFVIPAQNHGSHTILCYFEGEINGETVRSNTLYYNFMSVEDGNNTPIITSPYRPETVNQFTTIPIKYRVFTPNNYNSEIKIFVNDEEAASLTVDRTEQTFSYRAVTSGENKIRIVCGEVVKEFTIDVTPLDIDVHAETNDLALYLSSYGRSNREANPKTWVYEDIEARFDNFTMVSDGWMTDSSGITVLRVSGDARLTIPYKPFAKDFRSTGKTIEIEFATRDVLNYDANIISCMDNGRGFSLTAQKALLKSEQSEISTQYKEDEHIRIAFVVEKITEYRILYIYINGMISGAIRYADGDDFSQVNPKDIVIGSNDCTVDIYCIRIYDNSLTRFQVTDNWIADTQDGALMYERYTRNNIFDEYGNIVISKLPNNLPYMIMEGAELPQSKGDKKNVNITFTNPLDSSYSFTSINAQSDVQGTSSQYYPRKNYKIKFKNGFINNGETNKKYAMNADAIPTSTFTFKADFASSEGANNVELARLYNDISPYRTPYQLENSKIRQGIDGFPIVVFWNNGTTTSFVGKYNFNNDKGTEEVFGFKEGDESFEIKNNTSLRVLWKLTNYGVEYTDDEGVVHPADDWLNDFEGRYPDGSEDYTNLAALAEWIMSTDTEQATFASLPSPVTYGDVTYESDSREYRLAKFRNELPDHMEVDAVVFYYLFTELFLMVDSRAKNAFPTHMGDDKWFSLPYDFDTSLGINNEGALVFGYRLEDTDHLPSGADIYNGQQSVLWVNLRQTYFEEIKAMYQDLRSSGALSYAKVEKMFEDHQNKWPEALFNEDSYYKYILPLTETGDNYLAMLQGPKTEQRKWWMYNRFRYIDSKYNAGDSQTDTITIRGYAKSNITVVPYADIYPSIKYGSYLVQERGERGVETTLVCPLSNVSDTEIYIYSASQLATIGDISGFKPGLVNIASATRLQYLKAGDASSSYSNGNLTELDFGNNVLLKGVDVRNSYNLTGNIDMKLCTGLEEAYFDGTSVSSVDFANGGQLRILHLPSTITSLTLMNQMSLSEFVVPSLENLTTLRLENVSNAIDPIGILEAIPAGSRVRIIGFEMDVQNVEEINDFLEFLNTMRGLDEHGQNVDTAQVQGTIHVPSITSEVLAGFRENYPNINVTYDHITSKIFYYTYDGSELLYTETVHDGGPGVYDGAPEREETAQYFFTFAGWSIHEDGVADPASVANIELNRNVYAAYVRTTRSYDVKWINADGGILYEEQGVSYGTVPVYRGDTPVYGGRESNGWDPEVGPVTGDIVYTAVYLPLFTVWFYNGTTLLKSYTVVQGRDVVYDGPEPEDLSGEGLRWIGWSRTYGSHRNDPDALKNITSNTYIYASFEANYEYPTSRDVSNAYGVTWHYGVRAEDNSNTICTRVGLSSAFNNPIPPKTLTEYGYSPFDNIMPWSGMKCYNILPDGTKYAMDDSRFDPEAYDTMVYIPEFYYTAFKDAENQTWTWAISPTSLPGYCRHPGSDRYISKYYISGNSEAVNSKSGTLGLVSTSLSEFREYGRNKGSGWQMLDLATWSAVQMLFLIEYANYNIFTTIGYGYNDINAMPCTNGLLDSAVYHTVFNYYNTHTDGNMYRWIENPYKGYRVWTDGFQGNRTVAYAGVSDDGYSGSYIGLNNLGFGLPDTSTYGRFIKGFGYSEAAAWAFIPDESSDSSYDSINQDCSSTIARCSLMIGCEGQGGASQGFFEFNASSGSDARYSDASSRLIYIDK